MKIEGQERLALPAGRAFEALLDPALLRACTPGLARLDETQPGHYEATLDLKLPAISGRFEGTVDVVEREAPSRAKLRLKGKGAPGFVAQMEEKARNPGLSDGEVWAGRSMGYWRGLRAWRHSEQLLGLPQPLWLGFGGRDASVPLAGLDLFVQRAHARGRPLCLALFPDSDHGLSRGGRDDDLQQYWR